MPIAEVEDPKRIGSLKTEEKTKFVEPACQEDESCHWHFISTDPPVHQLGVVRTG
jgi:hypothetical protein